MISLATAALLAVMAANAQTMIDEAPEYSTVKLGPGFYGPLLLHRDGVTLKGDLSVISFDNSKLNDVYPLRITGQSCTVDGFVIENPRKTYQSIALHVARTSATIRNCYIYGGDADTVVALCYADGLTIENCAISGSYDIVSSYANTVLVGCLLDHRQKSRHNGPLWIHDASMAVIDCHISGIPGFTANLQSRLVGNELYLLGVTSDETTLPAIGGRPQATDILFDGRE